MKTDNPKRQVMKIIKIDSADGRCTYSVNMDNVLYAESSEEGITVIHLPGSDLQVKTDAYERAVEEPTEVKENIGAHITRLIQAMDRMTVHFPTSVRMHL